MDLSRLTQALDELVPEILDLCHAPGLSVALGMGEDVAWAKGYGHADLATRRPMTPDTTAPAGSDGKPYTATAVLQLVERGLIGLHDPVNDHLDDLHIANPYGDREITLWDLLTHRSGLGTNLGNWTPTPPTPLGDHLRGVFAAGRTDVFGGSFLPFWATKVGTNYQYSNLGIALVGYLVERLNPQRLPFSEYVHQHVFEPLRMTSTCFPPAQHPDHAPADLLARRSVGYATLGGYQFRLPQLYPGDYPAGAALTTPSDHVRFLLAMTGQGTDQGRLGAGRILRPETTELMLTPQAAFGPDPTKAIGLIWTVTDHGHAGGYFGHGGEYLWGWHHVARAWPHHRVAVAASANAYDLGGLGASDRPSHLAGRLVLGIVTAWVNGQDPRPRRQPAAAQSYLAGLIVAGGLTTHLGITTAPSAAEVARIAQATVAAAGAPWDPDAFRAAFADLAAAGGTLPALVGLTREQLPDHHRELLQRQLGVPRLGHNLPDLTT